MSNKALMVVSRRTPGMHVVDGSFPFTADCGCECWLTKESLAYQLSGAEMTTKCIECSGLTKEDFIEMGAEGKVKSVPGQRESLEREVGKANTDILMRLLGFDK